MLNSNYFRIENPSFSACDHPTQDTLYLILHSPARDSVSLAPFLIRSLDKPWKVARFLGLHGLPAIAHPSDGIA